MTVQTPSGSPPAMAVAPLPAKAGKPLPASGSGLPVVREQPAAAAVADAVQAIQQYLSESQRELQFQVDDNSGRTIIRVVDPATGDLIRQIPAEEVVKLAAAMRESAFNLVDDRA